jgi:hypothetical protein
MRLFWEGHRCFLASTVHIRQRKELQWGAMEESREQCTIVFA